MRGWLPGIILPCLLLTAVSLFGQEPVLQHRIILIGDAGELSHGRLPVIDQVNRLFPPDSLTTVVFLGDNIYPGGMPDYGDRHYNEARRILDLQAELGKNPMRSLYFIPGNHDWNKGRPGGWARIRNQQRYIDSLGQPNIQFLPRDGCPGPVAVDIDDRLTLIILDSQWWLHPYDKPGESDDCDCQTPGEVEILLNELISARPHRAIVLAMHHPLVTYGEHGGHFQFRQHIFPFTDLNPNLYIPLPVIGSLYPLSRKLFGNIQDTKHPLYQKLSSMALKALQQHPYAMQVAGHEHGLQYLQLGNLPIVVSGGGSKQTHITKGEYSRFWDSERGFAVLEMDRSGSMGLTVYGINADTALFHTRLFTLGAVPAADAVTDHEPFPDSVQRPVSLQYAAGRTKRWILGNNYRDAWSTPVKVRVINLAAEHGGLAIEQRGGGLQTRSLRLRDSSGKEYVLRSLEKFPESAIPEALRETFARDIVQDQISASLPFAALTLPVLAGAAGVPSAHPEIVYLPNDARLGKYRADFADQMYLYEEREPIKKGKTHSTLKMLEKLEQDNDNSVDQEAVLRARLLDMFVGDWDRHEDQWRWDSHDAGKGKRYTPVPRDRDQVFFVNEGWLPRLASKPWLLPKFQGFRNGFPDINRFNFNARFFDRMFLNNLSDSQWKATVHDFVAAMNDSVIRKALLRMPAPIVALQGEAIGRKLSMRRSIFEKTAMTYYRFLSKTVTVYGSDKNELFDIRDGHRPGWLKVEVHKLNKKGETEDLMFSREFDPQITDEIRLYGLDGKDSFDIRVSASKIRVRIIGGSGHDRFHVEGKGRPLIYDLQTEANRFSGTGRWRDRRSSRPEVNQADRRSYHYNVTAPLLGAGYNPDDGLLLGVGLRHTHYAFRRAPSAIHEFTILHAVATRAYMIRYRMQLPNLWHRSGLDLDARLESPDYVINFFGYGNSSVYDKGKTSGIEYYRTRFDLGNLVLQWRYQAGPTLSLAIGPALQYYAIDSADNANRYINETGSNGLDGATLYPSKYFAGWRANADLDTRNNKVMPSRGVWWTGSLLRLYGLNRFSSDITRLVSDLRIYWSSSVPATWVLAARFTGGINWGDFAFYQAQYLGGTENLRGYRKYRFAGRSLLANNLDLRVKVADFRTYLFPASWGITLFHDVGRVWYAGESSGHWHNGYGGGIWLAPLKTLVFSVNFCHSTENNIIQAALGYQF